MSPIEHYFENLLTMDSDIKGEPNKNALSKEVQEAIEICADYIKHNQFQGQYLTENCIACKYDETEEEDGEHCKKCLAGDSQFELDKEFVQPTTQERQAESDKFDAAYQDGYNCGYAQARFDYEQDSTTKNDLVLIHTEGLDEEIRCTMCTNYMKSDRGCDGSCVVNKDMYKAVMDAIEKRIQPTTKNNLAVDIDKLIADCKKLSFDIDFFNKPLKVVALDAVKNIVKDLPSVTPQEPCDKCEVTFKDDNAVSRLSVRDIIYANAYELEYPDGSSEYVVNRDELIKYLMELPSVTPQEPILDKVKQTREEIENEVKFWSESSKYNEESLAYVRKAKARSYKHCLEILDKLIESEG